MIAARVEDLPEPVGPVTSTMPLRSPDMFCSSAGKLRSANVGTALGITRITIAQVPRCMKAFTRNREVPARLYETSQEPSLRRLPSAYSLSPISSAAMWRVSSGVRHRPPIGLSFPLTSTIGGFPGEKNRSLILGALRSIPPSSPGTENGAGAGAAAGPAP